MCCETCIHFAENSVKAASNVPTAKGIDSSRFSLKLTTINHQIPRYLHALFISLDEAAVSNRCKTSYVHSVYALAFVAPAFVKSCRCNRRSLNCMRLQRIAFNRLTLPKALSVTRWRESPFHGRATTPPPIISPNFWFPRRVPIFPFFVPISRRPSYLVKESGLNFLRFRLHQTKALSVALSFRTVIRRGVDPSSTMPVSRLWSSSRTNKAFWTRLASGQTVRTGLHFVHAFLCVVSSLLHGCVFSWSL